MFYIQHDCELVSVRPHLKGTLLAIKTQALHTKAASASKANSFTVLSNGATGQAVSTAHQSQKESSFPGWRMRHQGLWGVFAAPFLLPWADASFLATILLSGTPLIALRNLPDALSICAQQQEGIKINAP